MNFTVVHSSSSSTKFPTSTLEDPLVFEFENKTVYGMREIASLFQKYYILNFPLKRSIQSRRKSTALEPYIADSSEFMILDFNDVQDQQARKSIVERFSVFRHVAFKTKSADDLFSFNFRIILATPPSTRAKIAQDLRKITKTIDPKLAKVNTSLYRKAQITAPGNTGIISINDEGLLFKFDDFKEAMCWTYTPNIRQASLAMFEELGFKVRDQHKESVMLVNERNGDFIFFDSSPFTITNMITGERVDIEREFKKRHKIDQFRASVPVKELLDWGHKDRIFTNKSVELGRLDETSLHNEINECISGRGCLVLRSPMGSGKTRVIRDMMVRSNSCLIITPRVSLADEFYSRFKDDHVQVYNKHRLESKTRNFICQFDSLYKIDTKLHKFDTIIIDEFMTLCDHMVSSVAENREFNIAKLLTLMDKASSMLVCDAFMERIALDLVPRKFKKVIWVSNETKDATSIIIHKEQNTFLQSMLNSRHGGLVISSVSVGAGMAIKQFLEQVDLKVGLINSATSLEVRERIIRDYKLNNIQALVYSPSVSVGVNVLGLRGSHFHYDPGNVIPVIQSVQMIRRSRNSDKIECFIKRNIKTFTPSLEEEKFNILQGNDTISGVTFNEDGDRALSHVGVFIATLRYHQKIWNMDSSKTFARLCHLNFDSVTSVNADSSIKLSLRSTSNLKEFAQFQKLEVFGAKAPEIQHLIELQEIDSFIQFEQFYRVQHQVEGWELTKDSLVQSAIFNLDEKLELFGECQQGIPAKDYQRLDVKLPKDWIIKTGMLWLADIELNPRFVEACEILHN